MELSNDTHCVGMPSKVSSTKIAQPKCCDCAMTNFRFFGDYAIIIRYCAIAILPSNSADSEDQDDTLYEAIP